MYTPKTLLFAATVELFLMVQVYQGDQFTFVQSWLVGLGTIYTSLVPRHMAWVQG